MQGVNVLPGSPLSTASNGAEVLSATVGGGSVQVENRELCRWRMSKLICTTFCVKIFGTNLGYSATRLFQLGLTISQVRNSGLFTVETPKMRVDFRSLSQPRMAPLAATL